LILSFLRPTVVSNQAEPPLMEPESFTPQPTPAQSANEHVDQECGEVQDGEQSERDGHRATLDALLGLLHDSGDPAAIRLCDDLGIAVDDTRCGMATRAETARAARNLAAAVR
jgi:hypothetical protein